MSSVVISGDTSGTVSVTVPAVAGTNTVTIPASTGTVMVSGNMPAFSAYANTTQSVTSSAFTKVNIDTKVFDTNTNFDTTLARFTPTVAGYYQVNGTMRGSGTSISQILAVLYKNGTAYARGTDFVGTASNLGCTINEVVYLNGTTDYVELYGFITATSPTFVGVSGSGSSAVTSRFSASMVRSA